MTKAIKWNGDFSNEPKTGVAVLVGDTLHITWSDGSKCITPAIMCKPQYGWTIG